MSYSPQTHVREIAQRSRDFYDFASQSEKLRLAAEFIEGPHLAYEGVHPNATDAERAAISQKRFTDRFNRQFVCPMGHHPEGWTPPPPLKERIMSDLREIADALGDRDSEAQLAELAAERARLRNLEQSRTSPGGKPLSTAAPTGPGGHKPTTEPNPTGALSAEWFDFVRV